MKQKAFKALVEQTYAQKCAKALVDAKHKTIINIAQAIITYKYACIMVNEKLYDGFSISNNNITCYSGRILINATDLISDNMDQIIGQFRYHNLVIVPEKVVKEKVRKELSNLYQKKETRKFIPVFHQRNNANIRMRFKTEDDYENENQKVFYQKCIQESHYFTKQDLLKCERKKSRKFKNKNMEELF